MDFSLKDIDIRSIIRDIFRHFLLILMAGISAYLLVFSISELTYKPEYTSTATLSISMKGKNGNPFSSVHTTNEIAGVFSEVFASDALRNKISQDLGTEYIDSKINIKTIEETNLMILTVVADTPKNSYLIINSALSNYADVSDYLFSNVSVHTLKEPNVPFDVSNPPGAGRLCKIAFLAASLITAGLTALFSFLRPTVKNVSEAKRKLDGDIIGVIPFVKKYRTKDEIKNQVLRTKMKNEAVLINSPRFGMQFKESVKKISTIVERHMRHNNQKVLLVTSVAENEGKSSVIANLAISFAQKGHKVLVIDADLRKPALHKIFEKKTENTRSLSDSLKEGNTGCDIFKHTKENVYCIHQYKSVGDAATILSSGKMKDILNLCREQFDYIFIDSSPLGLVTDCEILMQYCDSILVTVRQDHSPVGVINDITDVIRNSGMDFMGFVLNAFNSSSNSSHYGYGYGYGKYGYGNYSKTAGEKNE